MKTANREKQIGFKNGKIDAKNRNNPLVCGNLRKAQVAKYLCSPLVLAYWEGWLDGFNDDLPKEL